MFTHISTLLKAALYALILALIVHAGIFSIPSVEAASFSIGVGQKPGGSLGDDLVQFMAKIAVLNTFMHVMLLVILQFLGYLLQADFFNDPIMMGALNNIWQL